MHMPEPDQASLAKRDEVIARVDRLNLPSYTAFVQPRLSPVIDEAGVITDVRITYR